MPVFGCVGRHETLELPSRHLGLVQAREHGGLDEFLDAAAGHMRAGLDVEALMQLAKAEATGPKDVPEAPPLAPPGQRVAVAHDDSFAFVYPHLLDGWRRHGA